jgi:GMP synthase-like glutamine amidotransferase
MKPLLVLQNDADVPLGYLDDVLRSADGGYEVRRLFADEPLPGARGWQGIIVLGGAMGVYDAPAYPYLQAEGEMLTTAVRAGVPVLGICLGCQLLADTLGGRAFRAPKVEARFEVLTSRRAASDPVLRELDGPQFTFHRDTWEPPDGADVLLESPQYPQAFRHGPALGIQTHPEVTPGIARSWMETPGGQDMLVEAGVDGVTLAAAVESSAADSETMAGRFFRAWLAEAAGSSP